MKNVKINDEEIGNSVIHQKMKGQMAMWIRVSLISRFIRLVRVGARGYPGGHATPFFHGTRTDAPQVHTAFGRDELCLKIRTRVYHGLYKLHNVSTVQSARNDLE